MARYNKVKLGAIWLTSDATETGLPCKVTVRGLGDLILDKVGNTDIAVDGTPYTFLIDNAKRGISIGIEIFTLTKAVYDSIITEINNSLNNSTELNCVIQGETGDFTFNAVPQFPTPITSEKFATGYIMNTTINLVTTGV